MPLGLIGPVVEMLGMLGSGQFGGLNPTAMLGGVSQTLGSAGQTVQHALGGLDGVWQGAAASSAAAKTASVLANGSEVASQADSLSASLSAAVASVAQGEAQLVAIVNQFMATLAAIGPNIIFPWGWAAAIAAANQAVTQATSAMAQLQSTLGAQEANVNAVGAPVAVTSPPQVGSAGGAVPASPLATSGLAAQIPGSALSPVSAFAAPAAAAASGLGAPLGGASGLSSLAPMLGMASGLAMPAMEGISAATSGLGSAGGGPGAQLASAAQQPAGGGNRLDTSAHGGGGGGGHSGTGVPVLAAQSRLAPLLPEIEPRIPGEPINAAVAPGGMGGAPMMGGAPLARGGNGGVGRSHTVAAFLHTSDQGGDIVGELGNVAPPVIGVREAIPRPDIDLTI
ncbi:hypothetical protein [Mycobacterium sp. 1465703.0]|uniref:hypothetical protein n=1 Tax=Mycobacterium sp. 1465703.0 TaxID=1834078 RepID=UPI0012EA0104|nr:hypothetical protein [Mycobacterium sp. 1465703.0]